MSGINTTRYVELIGGPLDGDIVCVRAHDTEYRVPISHMERPMFKTECGMNYAVGVYRQRVVTVYDAEGYMIARAAKLPFEFEWQGEID